MTPNSISGLPFECFRFENGNEGTVKLGAARTSLKNRASRGKGEEGDSGGEQLSREHLGAGSEEW